MLVSANHHIPNKPAFAYQHDEPNEQLDAVPRVLLVEDDHVIRLMMVAMLQKHLGYVVKVTSSGEDAVTLFSQGFDLVIMDVGLPDLNGIDTTKKIRQLYPKNNTPIVAYTAHGGEKVKEQCYAAGMNAFISKGDSLETFEQVIAETIAGGVMV
jgi:CheY-like chemotaxis protein